MQVPLDESHENAPVDESHENAPVDESHDNAPDGDSALIVSSSTGSHLGSGFSLSIH